MRTIFFLIATGLFANAGFTQASDDFADVCHASSSYDLTITPAALLFDRASPSPRRVELRGGSITLDGVVQRINTESGDRVTLFEQELRALVPKAKAVARNGVDLAIKAMHAEAAAFGAGADTLAELDQKLAARGAELKQRIQLSESTHDWQDDAIERYAEDVVRDIGPTLVTDLSQQAIEAAVGGDLDAAAALRDRTANLGSELRPRLHRRMRALRPQIEALCPSLRRLRDLQRDIRGANGSQLDLLEIETK